jgi:hypothetical protein
MPPKATESTVIRMPQQHVREGRGKAGYQEVDGDLKVEVFATPDPYEANEPAASRVFSEPTGNGESAGGGKTRKDLDAEAEALGLNPGDYANKSEIEAAIAAKKSET